MRSILAAIAFLVAASPAFAVDFSQVLLDENGQRVRLCSDKGPDGKLTPDCDSPVTLGRAVSAALLASYPDEGQQQDPRNRGLSPPVLSGDEKVKRARLALSLAAGGEHDLSAEDVVLIKNLVAKAYAPLVVLRVWDAIDPPKQPKKDEKK